MRRSPSNGDGKAVSTSGKLREKIYPASLAYSLTVISLTDTLFRMPSLTRKSRTNQVRLIGAGLLLFIFFLPLHFHFSAPAQLTNE
jgi:hypothetical protein